MLSDITAMRPTMRERHNRAISDLRAIPVPPEPSVYATHADMLAFFADMKTFQRRLDDWYCAYRCDMADVMVDNGAGRAPIDDVQVALSDFIDAQEPSE